MASCGQDCGNCYNCYDKPKFGGPGIKKQACVNRKCLLMVPRDDDGERLARKRAKQRTQAPGAGEAFANGTPAPEDLSYLAAGAAAGGLGSLVYGPHQPRPVASLDSVSECSSLGAEAPRQLLWLTGGELACRGSEEPGSEEAARTQALSEQCLCTLAMDDDDDPAGRALTSAMLEFSFAAITPSHRGKHAAVAQHERVRNAAGSPLGKRGGAAQAAAEAAAKAQAATNAVAKADTDPSQQPGVAEDPSSSSPELALLKQALGIEDAPEDKPGGATSETHSPAAATSATNRNGAPPLPQAFTAQIQVVPEPPKPPRLDELHEEFLLLNAMHRCGGGEGAEEAVPPMPILAY